MMTRFLVLLGFCLVAVTQAQTLRILSQRQNAYALNGRMYQNNTITVQCTDADFGVYRYSTITKGDGSTVQLGVLCSPPVYSYELEEVGRIPRDTRFDAVAYCLTADELKVNVSSTLALLDRTTASAVIGNSLRRRKLLEAQNRHKLHPFRKSAAGTAFKFAAAAGFDILFGFAGGVAGGAAYCRGLAGGGCASVASVDDLKQKYTALDGSVTRLSNALDVFQGNFNNLTNKYQEMFINTNNRFDTVQSLFNNSISGVQASLDYVNGTNELLRRQNQDLQYNFQLLQSQATTTDANLASLASTLSGGISGVGAQLSNYIALQNNVTLDMHKRLTNVSSIAAANLVALRKQMVTLTQNLQYQINSIRDQLRETQARRAVAAYMQQRLLDVLAEGYSPFTFDLGIAPSPDTNPAVWRTLLETHRLLYVRDNLGLTAQMVDISYYCDTRSIIDLTVPLSSSTDFFSAMGPVGCNATLRQGCQCWIVTQRSSCSTSNARVTQGTWLQNNTLWTGNSSAICSSGITVNTAITHTTLPSFLSVMADVCNDGTFVNASTIRVISGQLLRVANVPYNPLVCSMALDTINDVANTDISFMYTMIGYLQMSFTVVLNNANYYSQLLYGQSPSGLTTIEDPLVVVNGTEARCLSTGMVSHDTTNPLLIVYRLRFVSATSSVTVKLDGVVTSVVTDVTASVPSSVVLPDTDTAVVGDPADSSEIWNIPDSELSLSPVAAARKGHITYPIATSLSDLTAAAWQDRNKDTFNHFDGTATAAYYRRTVNGTGMCSGNSLPGEGSWCTVRRDFAVSAAVGGFTLSPRTGTGATVIAQLTVADGAITGVIFSDCPTITLSQKNPGVATLALTNSRPDTDITVAILLGGQCTTTVPSFVIPKLETRDYLIPQCISNVASTRSVRVARYDSELNLVTCGNTTNITISRDTFISTYATPDLISQNISRLLVQDETTLRMVNTSGTQALVIASVIATIPTIFSSYGVKLPAETVDGLAQLITNLQTAQVLLAAQANATRDASLRNFTALFDEFTPRLDAAVNDGVLALNATKTLLLQLAAQNVNGSSILADIIVLTNTTQAALAQLSDAIKVFSNATRDFAATTLNTFADMNKGGDFDLLAPFLDFMGGAIRATGNGLNSAVDWAIEKASKTGSLLENLFEGLTGLPGAFLKPLLYIGIAAIGTYVLAVLFMWFYKKQFRKVVLGKLAITDLDTPKDNMTVEQAQAIIDMYNRAQYVLNMSRTGAMPLQQPPPPPQAPTPGNVTTAPSSAAVTTTNAPVTGAWADMAKRYHHTAATSDYDIRPLLGSRQTRGPPRPQLPNPHDDL
jgi:hypothetical protein